MGGPRPWFSRTAALSHLLFSCVLDLLAGVFVRQSSFFPPPTHQAGFFLFPVAPPPVSAAPFPYLLHPFEQ